jgi:hypothetical protein
VNRHFLEDAANEERGAATAAITASVIDPFPRFRHETTRRHSWRGEGTLCILLKTFEGRYDFILQLLEPSAGLAFAAFGCIGPFGYIRHCHSTASKALENGTAS